MRSSSFPRAGVDVEVLAEVDPLAGEAVGAGVGQNLDSAMVGGALVAAGRIWSPRSRCR